MCISYLLILVDTTQGPNATERPIQRKHLVGYKTVAHCTKASI
jgi:hypothetical protein